MRHSRSKHLNDSSTPKSNLYFVYARKSTESEERQIRSIGDQFAELKDIAEKNQLTVLEELHESQSAKYPGRPTFNEMLERIERGEANGILAWHPDRLARNAVDGGRIIHLIDMGKIRDLKFPTFWFEPTSQGKFMLSIMFSQSKYYVDNLSENIRRGQRQKLKNGIWPMVAPVGYLNDREARIIAPDPVRAPLVRTAYELYATGTYTIDRLVEALSALGLTSRTGNPLSRPQYHRLLQNPIYCGVICYGNETYEAKHEPIVSRDLFDAVQAVISRKSKPKDSHLKPYIYRGMFHCGECGAMITTETHKGFIYLRCTKRLNRNCSQPYVRQEAIDQQVAELFARITLPDDEADWMVAELKAEGAAERDALAEQRKRIQAKLDACKTRLKRLLALHLDDNLSLDEYRQAKAEALLDKAKIREQHPPAEGGEDVWFEQAIRFVKTQQRSHFMTKYDGKIEGLRDLLKTTGSNWVIREKRLSGEFKEPWKSLENHGRFAQRETAAPLTRAAVVGETSDDFNAAERGRFELPLPLRADRFSKPAHSTTLPPLRGAGH